MRLPFKNTWAHRVQSVLSRNRHRPMAGPAAPSPVIPVNAEWDEAFLRVESYLRAHHLESRVLVNQLTTDILSAARRLAADHPHEAPVTLAMQVLHARIGEWLVHALGEGDWADERFRARGRLALLLADVPHHCPDRFLSIHDLPTDLRSELARAGLQPGPELKLTSMPSAPLEFPLAAAAEQKWQTFHRSAFFRASASWLIIAGFLGIAWFATH